MTKNTQNGCINSSLFPKEKPTMLFALRLLKITAKRLPEAHIKKNQFGLVTVRVILRTSIQNLMRKDCMNLEK